MVLSEMEFNRSELITEVSTVGDVLRDVSTHTRLDTDSMTTDPGLYNNTTDNLFSNTTDNLTSQQQHNTYGLPPAVLWAYFAIRILWALLALFGNGLTILVVTKFKVLQNNNNFLICSLATADMLATFIVPLVIVYELYPTSAFYVPVCLIEKGLNMLCTAANMASILCISINTYIYFAFPLRYKTLVPPRKIFLLIGCMWTYICLGVSAIIYFSHLEVGMKCNYTIFVNPYVYTFVLTPHFLGFLLCTIVFYLMIAKIAYKQSRAIAAEPHPYDTIEATTSRNSGRICRMLGLVLGVYLIGLMPQYAVAVALRQKITKPLLVSEAVTRLIYWANTWLNPVIYVWRMKQFRIAFRKLLTGRGSFEEYVP